MLQCPETKIIGCSCVVVIFTPQRDSIEKPGHRLLWYKVDWHLLLTFGGCFLLATETKFLHTNTVSQDYPCTPGNISQLEPYAVCLCAWMNVSLTFLSWWCVFFWVISPSLMVIMLLDFLCVCTSKCAYDRQMRSRLPSQVPELPSNITHGLCFDPLASHSPQPPLKPRAYCTVCVCGATGMHAQCPLKPFVLQIYTILPLFPLPISPLLVRQCMQYGAYNGRTRLGSLPCSLCHQKSQRYTPLVASSQPKAFSKRERQLLSPLFLWILAENLLLDSSRVLRSLSWMMHAVVRWKSYNNRLSSP